jgi:hypothetical protein
MKKRAGWFVALLIATLAIAGCTGGPRGHRAEDRHDDPFPHEEQSWGIDGSRR